MSNVTLQYFRRLKGFTQSDLSEKAHVNLGTLRHYEQGTRDIRHTDIYTLVNICEVLDIKLCDLFNDTKLCERIKKIV